MSNSLNEKLRYHVTGAIERGEGIAIEAIPASYIIRDWAGNLMFSGQSWNSWDDAEAFLTEFLGDAYETDRGEYYIQEPEDYDKFCRPNFVAD